MGLSRYGVKCGSEFIWSDCTSVCVSGPRPTSGLQCLLQIAILAK